jgi:hypothetical protein
LPHMAANQAPLRKKGVARYAPTPLRHTLTFDLFPCIFEW